AHRPEALPPRPDPPYPVLIGHKGHRQDLDGHAAADVWISRDVDVTHPARGESVAYLVAAKPCPRGDCHGPSIQLRDGTLLWPKRASVAIAPRGCARGREALI